VGEPMAQAWGNPWFPHELPPSAYCIRTPHLASRPAKPSSGRDASCNDRPELPSLGLVNTSLS